MDSPNGIEWQYTEERERYIKTLNHTEVIYQIGDPHDPFNKHDQIKDYQNVILVRCNFLSLCTCDDGPQQGDRFVGYKWIRNNPQARKLGIPAEGGFACMIDCQSPFLHHLYVHTIVFPIPDSHPLTTVQICSRPPICSSTICSRTSTPWTSAIRSRSG